MIELINENHASTRFTYESQDRLIQEIGFDGRSQTYRYDAAGQLIEKTDAQDNGMAAQSEGEGTVRSRYHYDTQSRILIERRFGLTRATTGLDAFALTCRSFRSFPEHRRAQCM